MRNGRSLKKCGQLTVEYAVMFIALAIVIMAVSLSVIKPASFRFYNGVSNIIDGTTGQIQPQGSQGGAGGDSGSSGGGSGDSGGSSSSDTGGSGGGSTGDSGTGGSGDSGSGGTTTDGGGSGGETGGTDSGGTGKPDEKPPVIDSSSLDSALESLKTYDTGIEFYNLIESKKISIIYEDMTDSGWWGYWYAPDNKIAINSSLSESSSSLLASIIAHESTHADYTYNPQKWIDSTLKRHTELVPEELHISTYPYYSLDQEYMAFYEISSAWESLKGGETNSYMDSIVSLIASGEDVTKAYLRSIPDYADLPDY